MNPVATLLNTIAGPLMDRFFPDKGKAQEFAQALQLRALDTDVQLALAQLDVNKVEAASADPFVSRWRPFIGWVCGVGLAYHFIAQPMLAFLLAAAGHPTQLPIFDMDQLMTLLFGLLGLAGMRTYEKVAGATK